MKNKILKQYNEISELIHKEEEKNLDRLISSIVTIELKENGDTCNSKEKSDDNSKRRRDEHIVMTSLLSLRIHAGCFLIRSGQTDKLEQLREDLKNLVSNVKNLEYEWEITETVRRDSYDLLKVICDPKDIDIIAHNYMWDLSTIPVQEIKPGMFFLFTNISQYLQSIGQISEAMTLLEALCNYSRERNNPDHKELVCRVLTQICDDSPETTCRIADVDKDYFFDDTSIYAGDFYWFYGCNLENLGRTGDALDSFKKCYQIRKNELEETNYYTELVRREIAICQFSLSNGHEGKEDLKRFIDLIESGAFVNESDLEQLQILEAKTLCVFLMDLSDMSNPEEYMHYLKIYGHLCQKYEYISDPSISMRMAWNMRGGYYLNIGDYIQAESAFLNALKVRVNDESKSIISRIQIQSNLLLIYYVQNDLDKAYPLAGQLIEEIENDESGDRVQDADIFRIYSFLISMKMQSLSDPEEDEISEITNLLNETCSDLLSDRNVTISREEIVFAVICILYLIQQETASLVEEKHFSSALRKIEREGDSFDLAPMQWTILYYCQAILLWNMNDPDAKTYFEKTIHSVGNSGIQHTQKATFCQNYAAYLCKHGELNTGYHYIQKSLSEVTTLWHHYVQYLNDTRLLMILSPVQLTFSGCYAILRQIVNIETAYEQLLRFKALASLAGRERNRIIHKSHFNSELLQRIQQLQNAIAALESENILRDAKRDYDKQDEELRCLEKEFAVQFLKNIEFTDISLKAVQDAIPDYSAVLEYFLTADTYGQTQFEADNYTDHSVIDIYITTKETKNCNTYRITVPNGLSVMEDAKIFVSTMQHKSTGEATIDELDVLDTVRSRLYDAIIAPILPYIEGYGTVYIAPDNELVNLPFDLLHNEDKIKLADRHNSVKIECARDFLFKDSSTSSVKGTLIIGSPEYDIREREKDQERKEPENYGKQRKLDIDSDFIEYLPFSKVETYRVNSRIGGELYTGLYATKQVVLSAKGYENIHIATHGYFDIDGEDVSLYSSSLIFAGIKNWLRTGRINPLYGNGYVTADEVSRMDLSSTKLVVLSSCFSGMNDVLFNTGFYGMISALSAAGAKYVISNLWSVDDFATAVIMDAFYYYYANGWNEPPIALSKARDYLRNVTIDELKRQGWFHPSTYQMLDADSRNFMYSLENKNGKLRPFRDEFFWGGFTCYECH